MNLEGKGDREMYSTSGLTRDHYGLEAIVLVS